MHDELPPAAPLRPPESLPEPVPDEDVVRAVLAGDAELYELILRRHNQRLFRIVRAIVQDDTEAEDALQQAYVIAYQHLAEFAGRSAFATWLTRIAINEAHGRVRRRTRTGDALASYGEGVGEVASRADEPDVRASSRELRAVIEQAIDALPDPYRIVFVMRRLEGLSIAETAACLETNPGVVKVRLHRAQERLRREVHARVDAAVELGQAFPFAGARCDRIVAGVLARVRSA